MLINTYKPLNTLPGLIPRNFKLTCTWKHAHTQSWRVSNCPLTSAAACSPLIPPQVRAHCWGGLPCLLPVLQVLTAPRGAGSAVPVRGQGAQGVSAGGTSGFDYHCFHITISTPIAHWDPSFLFPFKLNSFFVSKVYVIAIYSGLWLSTSLTLWVLGWFCVFNPNMLFTATDLS